MITVKNSEGHASADSHIVEPLEQLLIERACTQLCYRFAHYLDTGQFDAMIALFTEDGEWDRLGEILRGHEAMRAAFKLRPQGITTRHVVTNIRFTSVSANEAAASLYNMSYHSEQQSPDGDVPYAAHNGRCIDFHDRYRLTKDGWRFSYRQAKSILYARDWREPVQ